MPLGIVLVKTGSLQICIQHVRSGRRIAWSLVLKLFCMCSMNYSVGPMLLLQELWGADCRSGSTPLMKHDLLYVEVQSHLHTVTWTHVYLP